MRLLPHTSSRRITRPLGWRGKVTSTVGPGGAVGGSVVVGPGTVGSGGGVTTTGRSANEGRAASIMLPRTMKPRSMVVPVKDSR